MAPHLQIQALLDDLRKRVRAWLVVDGLSRVLALIAAFIAVDLVLDWTFQLDRPQRMIMLALAMTAIGLTLWRRLLRPLADPGTDNALAHCIEERRPQLHEQLISALELARLDAFPPGTSPELARAAIDQGVTASRQIHLASLLDRRRLLANSILLMASFLAIAGTAAATTSNETIATWFDRNILLSERAWPSDVHFRIVGAVDGVLPIPHGDDWLLETEVTRDSRRIPEEAWLELREGNRRERMESVAGADRRFQTTLSAVTEPFEFRIVESRAATDWHRVRLVERPAVRRLTLVAQPPAYLRRPAEELPAAAGPYQLLRGSSLTVTGEATKLLSAATITRAGVSQAAALTGDGRFTTEIPADQLKDGDYSVSLLDTESLHLPRCEQPQPLSSRVPVSFRIRLQTDRPPQVQARLIGISGVVTDRAQIPIDGKLTDDFGIAAVRLERRHRLDDAEMDVIGEVDLSSSLKTEPAGSLLSSTLDLAPLKIPPGTSLSFLVEARDFNDVTGPGIGRSGVFVVRIVTDEEFRAGLLSREREQATELERQVKLQDELLTETKALEAESRGTASLDAASRDQLTRIRRRQKSIGEAAGKIARRFEEMVQEIRNNRLEPEDPAPLQTRLRTRIIAPFWKVANDESDRLLQALDQSLGVDSAEERSRRLGEVTASQARVAELLRQILSQMEQSQGFQEAVNLLLEVQKAQEDVLKRTEEEKQEAIRKLLNPSPK